METNSSSPFNSDKSDDKSDIGFKQLIKKRSLFLVSLFKKGLNKNPIFYFKLFLFILLIIIGFWQISNKNSSDNKLIAINRLLNQEKAINSSQNNVFLFQNKVFSLDTIEVSLIEKSSLKVLTPPQIIENKSFGSLFLNSDEDNKERDKTIIEYIVEKGDTISSLAEKFNISIDTILWANGLKKNSTLKLGQKLIIPPVSGIIHYVKEKDTISEIAEKYQAKVEDIISFNELSLEGNIFIGDILVIPNGKIKEKQPSSPSSWAQNERPLANSFFICPTANCNKSQGLHWYNAIDFSGKCGDPIRAAAGGEIVKVALTSSTSRTAFGGAGNHITIMHPNGVITYYGHISQSLVDPGDSVRQGQTIALMGGKPGTPGAGKSTGCHVHFAVKGAKNPFGP